MRIKKTSNMSQMLLFVTITYEVGTIMGKMLLREMVKVASAKYRGERQPSGASDWSAQGLLWQC